MLNVVVSTDGHATDIRVMKPLDEGLAQNAIDAVQKYLFEPVAVFATVEVPFRLK